MNDNRRRIKDLRGAISEIIRILETPIVFEEDYTGTEVKSSIKVKKNAFLRAKYLLSKLQIVESENSQQLKEEWYKNTISSLVVAAEFAIAELSKIMQQKVNTDEPSSAINSAIDSKQEAYDYMDDIFIGKVELQDILTAIENGEGVRNLKVDDFKSGIAEDHAYTGFYAKKKRAIEPGYNKDLDAIVISYDGTIGDIIECYGLRIALPKNPKKKDVVNYKKKKELQFWERPKLPSGITKTTAHLFRDEIEEEFRRRDEGYWFMNNGDLEYITGPNYMLLTYMKTNAEDHGFFHFRKAHRDLFYFLEAAWVDSRSLGVMLGKTRRTGATYAAAAFFLTKAISSREAIFGLTSKKNSDAKAVFEKESTMFKGLPFFFKPLNTGEGLSGALRFSTPSKRTTKNNQGKETVYDDLNTYLDYQATTEDSYDSLALKGYIGDEISKWTKGNILTHWSKIRKTLLSGRLVRGKAFLLSTVEYMTGNDPGDDSAKSGDRFKHLFYQSDPNKRNEMGMTVSGLYKIFISSLDNYDGFIDRYGNCISYKPDKPIVGVDGNLITVGVMDYLNSLWAPYKNDPATLNDEKRKDPITEADMFRIASEDSLFNVINIQDEIEYNDKFYLKEGHPNYKRVNFRPIPGKDGEYEPYETPKGRFQISWFPPKELQNKKIINNGIVSPGNNILGCFGIDPYKVNKVKYGVGSKGSIIGYLGDHVVEGIPANQFFCVYIDRPQNLNIFFNDAIMCLTYFGMQALIENNVNELLVTLYNAGLTRYSMRRPDTRKLSVDESMYGGIPGTNVDLIRTEAAYLEKYIDEYIGYATSENKYRPQGDIGLCPFNDLLSDFAKFDVNDRTKFDATVSACLAIYGAQKFYLKSQRKKSKTRLVLTDIYNLQ